MNKIFDSDKPLIIGQTTFLPGASEPINVTILPKSHPKKLRLGWVIHEEIGFAVIDRPRISVQLPDYLK